MNKFYTKMEATARKVEMAGLGGRPWIEGQSACIDRERARVGVGSGDPPPAGPFYGHVFVYGLLIGRRGEPSLDRCL